LIDSYTKFSNKVGLTVSNKHIQQINEVVLSFPFKDCVLEGGQSNLRVCRAKRLLPLIIRLSLIKPFSSRLKFTSSLTPFWVYFLALVMTLP
jgi:hypothetical protein